MRHFPLFVHVCCAAKDESYRDRRIPSSKSARAMIPQSAPNAVRGARGGTRGAVRKYPPERSLTDTRGGRAPTKRATPPRPTHCNYLSPIRFEKLLTRHTGSVIALPIVSPFLHPSSPNQRGFTVPGPPCRVAQTHGEIWAISVEPKSAHSRDRRVRPNTSPKAPSYSWGYGSGEYDLCH